MESDEVEVPIKAENPPGNVVEAPVQEPIIAESIAPIDKSPKEAPNNVAEIPQPKVEIVQISDSESCSSSQYTSSSCSSSGDEDSSTSSATDEVEPIVKKKNKYVEEESPKVASDMIMSKNEVSGDKITIAPVTVTVGAEDKLEYMGSIFSILEKEVIIRSSGVEQEMRHMWDKEEIGKVVAFDSGTIVSFENREILGTIFDTCGPVQAPYYIVRFNSAEEISGNGKIGARVYAVEKHKEIIVGKDIRNKGYDTSNKDDEECDTGEYSDDEEEREARRRRTLSNRQKRSNDDEHRPLKQTRGGVYESKNPYAEQGQQQNHTRTHNNNNRTVYESNHQRGGRGRGRGRNRGRGRGGGARNNSYQGGGYIPRNDNNMGNFYKQPSNATPQHYPPQPGAYPGNHHYQQTPPQQPHIAQQMMQARVQHAPNAAGYDPHNAGAYHVQPPPSNSGAYHGGPPSCFLAPPPPPPPPPHGGGYGQPSGGGYAQPPGYPPYQYVPVQQQQGGGAPGQLAPYPSMVWGGSHWNGSQYVPNAPVSGYYAAAGVPQAQMQAMAGMRNMTVGENSNNSGTTPRFNGGQYEMNELNAPPPPNMGGSGQANPMPHPPPQPSSNAQPAQTDQSSAFPPNEGR